MLQKQVREPSAPAQSDDKPGQDWEQGAELQQSVLLTLIRGLVGPARVIKAVITRAALEPLWGATVALEQGERGSEYLHRLQGQQ